MWRQKGFFMEWFLSAEVCYLGVTLFSCKQSVNCGEKPWHNYNVDVCQVKPNLAQTIYHAVSVLQNCSIKSIILFSLFVLAHHFLPTSHYMSLKVAAASSEITATITLKVQLKYWKVQSFGMAFTLALTLTDIKHWNTTLCV